MQPERVRRGSIAPAIVLVVGAVALVAAALLASVTASPGPGLPSRHGPAAAASDRAGPTAEPAATSAGQAPASVLVTARPIPPIAATICHDLGPVRCRAIIVATVRRLPASAPPVVSVAAWGSLLCGDARDCPASRLDNGRSLGSAVVEFGPGRGSAWVNVVAPRSCRHPACRPVAWLIRWAG
jgi:hypothetical protein